jgi:hypothetical protein
MILSYTVFKFLFSHHNLWWDFYTQYTCLPFCAAFGCLKSIACKEQSECSVPSNLCYAVAVIVISLTCKRQSLFRTTAGVRTDVLSLYIPANTVSAPFFHFPSRCHITFLHFWTWLPSITMFYKCCTRSNQQLAFTINRLMHSIHCIGAIFTYQAL